MIRSSWPVGVALALVAVLGACGGDDDGAGITAANGWARSTAPGAPNAAFYLEIDNATDEAETLSAVRADICEMTEVHETSMVDGVMAMAPAEDSALVVRAGEALTLEPGGLHVMCLGLVEQLEVDDTIALELGFASGVTVAVEIDVREP